MTSEGSLSYDLAIPLEDAAFMVTCDGFGDSLLTIISVLKWAQGIGGDWDDPARWSPADVPNLLGNARIAARGTYTVTSASDNAVNVLALTATTATLAIEGGTTFTVGHRIVDDGTITLGSAAESATLQIDGTARLVGGGYFLMADNAANLIDGAPDGTSATARRPSSTGRRSPGPARSGRTI